MKNPLKNTIIDFISHITQMCCLTTEKWALYRVIRCHRSLCALFVSILINLFLPAAESYLTDKKKIEHKMYLVRKNENHVEKMSRTVFKRSELLRPVYI